MSIATEISRLQTAKADLKTAIEAKGVTVPSATTLDGYATLVGQISSGGGATNFVSGTFTPSENNKDTYETLSIPYSGSGYPIMCMIVVSEGAYNSAGTYYNVVQQYAITEWFMNKARPATAPSYATSGAQNYGATGGVYKSSASSATSHGRTSAMNTNTFSSSAPTAAVATAARFSSATTLRYFVANTSYGFRAGTQYTYYIVYSS